MRNLITALLVVVALTGCYNQRKATVQHGRAVATFPEIGADYCARTYPPDTTFRPGDTLVVLDTLYVGGEIHFDTVYSQRRDTVYITRYVQGAHTIERHYIRDTVVTVDRASLDAANIDRKKAVDLLAGETIERRKYQKQARTRLWILIAIGAVAGGWIVWKVRKK